MQTVTKIKDLHQHLSKRLGPGKHPFKITSKSGNGDAVITSGGFSIRLSGQDKEAWSYVSERLSLPEERAVFVIEDGEVTTPNSVTLKSFKLAASSYKLYPEEKVTLSVTEETEGYVVATTPKYKVVPKGLGKVNDDGEFVAIAKGKAKVIGTLDGVDSTVEIEILPALPVLKGFSVTTEKEKLAIGDECRVTVTAIDEEGYTPVDTSYSIDNDLVAAINPDGVVTGILEGLVTITVAIDGVISETIMEVVTEDAPEEKAPEEKAPEEKVEEEKVEEKETTSKTTKSSKK